MCNSYRQGADVNPPPVTRRDSESTLSPFTALPPIAANTVTAPAGPMQPQETYALADEYNGTKSPLYIFSAI